MNKAEEDEHKCWFELFLTSRHVVPPMKRGKCFVAIRSRLCRTFCRVLAAHGRCLAPGDLGPGVVRLRRRRLLSFQSDLLGRSRAEDARGSSSLTCDRRLGNESHHHLQLFHHLLQSCVLWKEDFPVSDADT